MRAVLTHEPSATLRWAALKGWTPCRPCSPKGLDTPSMGSPKGLDNLSMGSPKGLDALPPMQP